MTMMKTLLAATMVMGSVCAATAAQAATTVTYEFNGRCIDCAGFGVGQLVLKDYTAGQSITSANFVSFHYDGTNLYGPFTITTPRAVEGFMQMQASAGSISELSIRDAANYFYAGRDGSWTLGKAGALTSDYGVAGSFTLADAVATAVPEPATWAMMLVGFGMVGGAARYRRRGMRIARA